MAGQLYCFGDRSKADRISVVGKRALPLRLAYGKRGEGVGRALRGCPASSAVAGEWSGLRWRRVNTPRASYPIVTLVDRNPKAGQEFAHVSAAATLLSPLFPRLASMCPVWAVAGRAWQSRVCGSFAPGGSVSGVPAAWGGSQEVTQEPPPGLRPLRLALQPPTVLSFRLKSATS